VCVALVIQHAELLCLYHIVPHYLINGTIMGIFTEHKIGVLIFPTTWFETLLIPRRIEQVIVINVQTSSCKVPIILVRF